MKKVDVTSGLITRQINPKGDVGIYLARSAHTQFEPREFLPEVLLMVVTLDGTIKTPREIKHGQAGKS